MPERPRVLMVARPPLAGMGFPRLAEALQPVADVAIAMPADTTLGRYLAALDFELFDMPEGNGSRAVGWIARAARAHHSDVIHAQTLASAIPAAMAARLAGLPSVWHVREIVGNPLPGRRLAHASPATLRRTASTLPSIVMASSATALRALPGARFGRVVPDAVPPLGWPTRDPRENVRRVGIVGRVARQHGQDVFAEGFARAFDDEPDVKGLIIGRVPTPTSAFARQLRSLLSAWQIADQVQLVGRVPDMPSALQQLDVLVHCSRPPGGFRAVVVEAMLAGIPVVVTEGTGPAEVVEDGVSGLVIPPDDPLAVEFALARLAADAHLRHTVTEGALDRARDFAPKHAVAAVMNGYLEILGR